MKKRYFAAVILAGFVLRLFYVRFCSTNCDEAFLGLISKFISECREFPIFIHKAHYTGTLICYLVALPFKVWGVSLAAFRLVAVAAYWFPFLLFSCLFSRAFRDSRHTLLVCALCSLTPPEITQFTATAIGTYGETFAVVAGLMVLLARYYVAPRRQLGYGIAFVSGFGLWLSPSLIYFIGAVAAMHIRMIPRLLRSRKSFFAFCFFCLGSLPAIIYNIRYPFASFLRFGGRMISLDRAHLSGGGFVGGIVSSFLLRLKAVPLCFVASQRLVFAFPTAPNSLPYWFAAASVPMGLLYLVSLYRSWKDHWRGAVGIVTGTAPCGARDGAALCVLYSFSFFVLFSFFSCKPSQALVMRFIAPLFVVLPFFLADTLLWLRTYLKKLFVPLLALFFLVTIVANAASLDPAAVQSPRSLRQLTEFLSARGLREGYAHQDIAYPVDFFSRESLTYSPALFSEFEERYPQYGTKVSLSPTPAYIFYATRGLVQPHSFEGFLRARGISFSAERCGGFVIYYGLTRPLSVGDFTAEELSLLRRPPE